MEPISNNKLTLKILTGTLLGLVIGVILHFLPSHEFIDVYLIDGFLNIGGKLFIAVIQMMVVPIVFVSLVAGTSSLGDKKKFGRMAGKTLLLYIFTTALAITLGLCFAHLFNIGAGSYLTTSAKYVAASPPSVKQTILNIVPTNPIKAMVDGNMLQVIVLAILLGSAISLSGEYGQRVKQLFLDFNEVVMKLITMLMQVTPYGVFCLIAALFARNGFGLVSQLIGYFMTVLFVLFLHGMVSNSVLIKALANLNPYLFFRKMFPALIFAFSTASSIASIPIVMRTVEKRLGVHNSVASFVIPLGATINMDGTAIMQGVATVFIAHAYGIPLGILDYLTVIAMATLASIGTAGVPGVGLITLAMVLKQVGLPIEGIALIIGVDRLLDMVRTAVNITGDSAVSCVVAKSENELDVGVYKAD